MDDVNRFEQFCQFREKVRQSRKHLIVGIDIAKDKHHAFFGTSDGRTLLKRLLFFNDIGRYRKLIDQVNVLLRQHHLDQVVFGLEPTSNYHKPLAVWLIEQEYMVVLVGGKAVKDNRELLDGRWDKNNTKDSANVADLVSRGKCQFYESADLRITSIRGLLAVRKQLKKEEHRLRMRIRNGLIAKHFPELDRFWSRCQQENLAIVKWYLDPQKITETDFKIFVRDVTSTDRGVGQIRLLHIRRESSRRALRQKTSGGKMMSLSSELWNLDKE